MGTALRNPGQMIALACDSASVAAGAALFQGASNDSVMLPSAANTRAKFVGLAYQAGSATAGEPITVVLNGVWAATSTGTITRGDRLVAGATTGTVQSESLTTPPDATCVGVALESVTTGQIVSVLIGDRPSFRGTVLTMTAGVGGVTANALVIAAADTAVLPGGASPTGAILGVSLNTAIAGATCYVVTSGSCVVTCGAGAGVTANDFITASGATGLGLTAAPGAGTNCSVVGIALNTVAASGAITVSVCPSRIQG